jgi:hypothetical protein
MVQPGLECDAVHTRNATPAIPHLHPACACAAREEKRNALLQRAIYDQER